MSPSADLLVSHVRERSPDLGVGRSPDRDVVRTVHDLELSVCNRTTEGQQDPLLRREVVRHPLRLDHHRERSVSLPLDKHAGDLHTVVLGLTPPDSHADRLSAGVRERGWPQTGDNMSVIEKLPS